MFKKFNQFKIDYLTILLTFFSGLLLPVIFSIGFAWTQPSKIPPTDNTPAPLDSSSNSQEKSGKLILGTGTPEPEIALTVSGNINKADGSDNYQVKSLGSAQDNNDIVTKKEVDDYFNKELEWYLAESSGNDYTPFLSPCLPAGAFAQCPYGYNVVGGGCYFSGIHDAAWSFFASTYYGYSCGLEACVGKTITSQAFCIR